MRRRLSVRLPDELAQGIDARARRSGKTKSEVVRDALRSTGVGTMGNPQSHAQLMERAASLRARQTEVVDAACLVRKSREDSPRRPK
jgi:Arc/MetJ-type ribon-helix-helix transcriptional regulator